MTNACLVLASSHPHRRRRARLLRWEEGEESTTVNHIYSPFGWAISDEPRNGASVACRRAALGHIRVKLPVNRDAGHQLMVFKNIKKGGPHSEPFASPF